MASDSSTIRAGHRFRERAPEWIRTIAPCIAQRAGKPVRNREASDTERHTIEQMMAKGTYAGVNLATPDLDALFEVIEASGADIIQEPLDQDYGLRDCAVRDPAGNLIRIQQRP